MARFISPLAEFTMNAKPQGAFVAVSAGIVSFLYFCFYEMEAARGYIGGDEVVFLG